ncbi:hypothetical protein LIA77_01237 [Sarocladium implicatum]|nr:hypothetical protein LIA77_01237 [Sarocladium implicatum]
MQGGWSWPTSAAMRCHVTVIVTFNLTDGGIGDDASSVSLYRNLLQVRSACASGSMQQAGQHYRPPTKVSVLSRGRQCQRLLHANMLDATRQPQMPHELHHRYTCRSRTPRTNWAELSKAEEFSTIYLIHHIRALPTLGM